MWIDGRSWKSVPQHGHTKYDVFAPSARILGCHTQWLKPKELFEQMQQQRGGEDPNCQLCWCSKCMCQCNTRLEEHMHAHEHEPCWQCVWLWWALRVFNRMPICDVIAQRAMIVEYVLMQTRAPGIGTSLTNVTEGGLSKPCHICLDASATVAATYRRLTCSGTDCSSWLGIQRVSVL